MTCLDTILVIDNDLSVGKLITNILVREGKRVLLASSAKEGMEHLRNERVDILLTDLRLLDEDGTSVIQKSLQVHPHIATVVFTTAGTLETAIEALRMGACDYIIKPFNRQQIVTTIHRAINWARHTKSAEKQKAIPPSNEESPPVTFLATSPSMREVVVLANKLSHIDFPVLIQGELGVGKQLLARLIHSQSSYANGPFSHVNCSVIIDVPKSFKTFIHALFKVLNDLPQDDSPELSTMGTIYFENIDQLPKWAQHQLLDMLEEGCIRASCSTTMAVRMIASTTVNLKTAVSADQFHRSLYDHLNVIPIKIPPLRERREDIKPLGIHLLEQLCRSCNRNSAQCRHQVTEEMWEFLHNYDWPGNVQELVSVLSRIVFLRDRSILKQLQHTQQPESTETISVPFIGDLKSMERHMICEVVKLCGGNKAAAARSLGMHRRTLYRVLENEKQDPESHQTISLHH
tara:strand:+ start:18654 stop:20036 length:1383 start_codon:yes stop_codon:yes gene_type:complete